MVDGTNSGLAGHALGWQRDQPEHDALGAGNHMVVAQYSGDPNYAANSGSYTQVVNRASLILVVDDQQMNHYDAVPTLTYHYTGFVNGDQSANSGITASVNLSTTASSTSSAGYYPITPTVNSFTAPNYILAGIEDGTLTVKPRVMDVVVHFAQKSMSLIGLNRDLPFINIKTVDVIFSDDVNVSVSMLQLTGVNVSKYSFNRFRYNRAKLDATWMMPSAIGVDRLMLSMSGETASPIVGSGPPIAADQSQIKFAVLPGDVSADGMISEADLQIVSKEIKSRTYTIWADVDGNGVVNRADLTDVHNRRGSHFP